MSKFTFFEGRIVPSEQARVSVRTQALHYGTSCFGGIRGYWDEGQGQLFVFRMVDHYERFVDSTRLLRMELPYSARDLTKITLDLLRRETWNQDIYIRPLAYKAGEMIGCQLHDIRDEVTIYAVPFGRYLEQDRGAHVTISSWRRVDDNAIPPRGKIGGAYANSALIKSDAVLAGFDEALVLNESGHLSEGSAANVFLIRKGVAVTPPISENILEGITRRTTIEMLTDELGVEVVERPVDRSEIYLADEVFFCGTGVQIAAITQVDHRLIGSGEMGPITEKLRQVFFDTVRGRTGRSKEWCLPVYVE